MLLYMLIGYINGFFHKNYIVEDVLLPLIVIVIDDLIFNFFVYIFSFLLKNRLEFGLFFTRIIIPEMLTTALLTIIIYKFYVFVNKLLKKNAED